MANALKDLGQEVQIINTTDPNKVLAAIKEFDPDFVHINYDDFIVLYPHIDKPKAMTSHFGYLERPDMMNGYVNIFNKFQEIRPNVFCLSEGIKNIYKIFSNFPEDKLFVTPLIADDNTITLYFFLYLAIILATFLILLVVPTEVPPNFNTIIFIDNFY